jgi:hypothetical protein
VHDEAGPEEEEVIAPPKKKVKKHGVADASKARGRYAKKLLMKQTKPQKHQSLSRLKYISVIYLHFSTCFSRRAKLIIVATYPGLVSVNPWLI